MRRLIFIASLIAAYKFVFARQIGADVRKQVQGIKAQHKELAFIPESLVVAIARVESNLDPSATGQAGEYGLMQIMPSTYSWLADFYNVGLSPGSAYHPFYNVYAGMLYLKYLYDSLGNWFSVIHAYNVGLAGFNAGRRNNPYFAKVIENWIIC